MSMGAQSSQSSSGMTSDSWMRAFSNMVSNAQSTQDSQQRSASFVDQNQQPFLNNMYQLATSAANPAGVTAAAQQASGQIIPGMQGTYGNIGALTDTSGQIQAQTRSLKKGLTDMFQKELMPAIQGNAIASGGFGGGRQGVAEGVATGEIADAFIKGRGDIVANANQTAISAGSLMPQLAQGLYTAYTAPQMAGLDPMARLSSILGSPTILSRSRGTSTGQSTSSGRSRSRTRSESTARSGSSSESSGWSFGIR